eukprot:434491_1
MSTTYTGIIKNHWLEQNSNTNKVRSKLSLITEIKDLNTISNETRIVYLYDEWHKIMQYLWKNKHTNTQISITLNNIPIDNNTHTYHTKTMQINSSIEFKTNLQRICNQNGIILDANNILEYSNDLNRLNNNYFQSNILYIPLSELKEMKTGANICGYITKSGPINKTNGIHKYSKQIRIRDLSLNKTSFDFEIMLFNYTEDGFPICELNDIIQFNNLFIKWRTAYSNGFFQATIRLNENVCKFTVINHINGNIKYSNINNRPRNNLDKYFMYLNPMNTNNNINIKSEIKLPQNNNIQSKPQPIHQP